MIKRIVNEFSASVKGYMKENWGAPFIFAFISLLVTAAFSLSMGLTILADVIAIFSYCTLVVGVILQLFCFFEIPQKEQ